MTGEVSREAGSARIALLRLAPAATHRLAESAGSAATGNGPSGVCPRRLDHTPSSHTVQDCLGQQSTRWWIDLVAALGQKRDQQATVCAEREGIHNNCMEAFFMARGGNAAGRDEVHMEHQLIFCDVQEGKF